MELFPSIRKWVVKEEKKMMETKLIENKDTTLNGHRPQSLVIFISHDNIRHNMQTHPIFSIMLSTTPEFDRVLSSARRVAA
jgi:hypothetical protein